jgi:hypothetical protein
VLAPYAVALLGLIGLARRSWRTWRKRPSISLALGNGQEVTVARHAPGQPIVAAVGIWERLLVSNEPERNPAEDTHVVLVAYEQVAPPGERVETRMALAWTHSEPTSTLSTLHGGSPRFIDLVSAIRGDSYAQLETHPKTVGPPVGFLQPNTNVAQTVWRVELELVARGVAPIKYRARLSWTGRWVSGPGSKHLRVHQLELSK